MSFIELFIFVFVISLIGSLPPGMISVTVAINTLKDGIKNGLWIAFGAVLVEWFQSFFAVRFAFLFTVHPEYETALLWISMFVFFVLAAYYLLLKPKSNEPSSNESGFNNHFIKGIFISSANVMVFPYWIFYSTYAGTQGWMGHEWMDTFVFCTAVSFGSFTAFWGYGILASRILSKIENIRKIAHKTVGLLFLGFSLFQAWQLFF
ncbi:MAG: LysE family transporter [Saprospiraceae bacterium]|nr:LysE family transporter [Saprospiraceae bacterium]